MEYKKIVVVPCVMEGGLAKVGKKSEPPYGYHHVLGLYSDNYYRLIATVDSLISEEILQEVVKIIAGDNRVEVDPEYYERPRTAR